MVSMSIGTEHKRYTTVTQGHAEETLVKALDTIRKRDGQSVPEFAARLGISYPMLAALRRGDRQPGPQTLRAIMQTLPELLLVVLEHMRTDGGRPRRQAAPAAVDNEGEGELTSRPPQEV